KRLEIRRQPVELSVADHGGGVRDVVEHREVHPLVIEGVVRAPEELLVGLAGVERGVVLAGHEPARLHPQAGDDRLELPHPATAAFPSKEDTMRKWMRTIAIFGALCSCAGASHAREDELSGTWRGVVRKGAIETVVLFDFSRTEGGYRGNYWGAAPLQEAIP